MSVGSVDIALTDSRGDLERLTIGNPSGFTTDYALRVNDIQLTLDLASLSSDTPVITEMLLDDAHVNAEQRGESTNLTAIQRFMGQSEGESAGTEAVRLKRAPKQPLPQGLTPSLRRIAVDTVGR